MKHHDLVIKELRQRLYEAEFARDAYLALVKQREKELAELHRRLADSDAKV